MNNYTFWVVSLVLFASVFAFVYVRQIDLPKAKPSTISLGQFSEGRAVKNLHFLAGQIGPRVVVIKHAFYSQ
jgi:hypothetical protein